MKRYSICQPQKQKEDIKENLQNLSAINLREEILPGSISLELVKTESCTAIIQHHFSFPDPFYPERRDKCPDAKE